LRILGQPCEFYLLCGQLGAGSNPPAVHTDALAAGTTEATLLVALNGARERLAADAGGAEQVAAAGTSMPTCATRTLVSRPCAACSTWT
jgi:hypothetical protein